MSPIKVVLFFFGTFFLVMAAIGGSFYFIILPKLKSLPEIRQLTNTNTLNTEIHKQSSVSPAITVTDVQQDKRNNYNKYILAAHDAYGAGQYAQVLSAANNALENANSSQEKAEAHYWIGLYYFNVNDYTTAENEQQQSIQLNPQTASPSYANLSAIAIARNDAQKALSYAQKAVELDPNNPWAYNDMGIAYGMLGNYSEAIKMLEKAVSLAPDRYVFRDNLTRTQKELKN